MSVDAKEVDEIRRSIRRRFKQEEVRSMSRILIDFEDQDFPISLNTFFKQGEEWCQITTKERYVQFPRSVAVEFFRRGVTELTLQIETDENSPPWWQRLYRSKYGKKAAGECE